MMSLCLAVEFGKCCSELESIVLIVSSSGGQKVFRMVETIFQSWDEGAGGINSGGRYGDFCN